MIWRFFCFEAKIPSLKIFPDSEEKFWPLALVLSTIAIAKSLKYGMLLHIDFQILTILSNDWLAPQRLMCSQ